jgi:hypothetical protein
MINYDYILERLCINILKNMSGYLTLINTVKGQSEKLKKTSKLIFNGS